MVAPEPNLPELPDAASKELLAGLVATPTGNLTAASCARTTSGRVEPCQMKSFESQAEYEAFCRANLELLERAQAESRRGPLIEARAYGLAIESDEGLLQQYTRHHEGQFQVVAELLWDGHRNEARWETTDSSPDELLLDPRYFMPCLWCGRRKHQGQLGSNQVCYGCQEYFFGVRY